MQKFEGGLQMEPWSQAMSFERDWSRHTIELDEKACEAFYASCVMVPFTRSDMWNDWAISSFKVEGSQAIVLLRLGLAQRGRGTIFLKVSLERLNKSLEELRGALRKERDEAQAALDKIEQCLAETRPPI